jgi:micrococcal nuclease
MRIREPIGRALLLIAICAVLAVPVGAASIFGKVIEVNGGDTITVLNQNRPVKVHLIGIDAPKGDQPHAEAARRHLSDLILGKNVTVEYSGLVQNNYLLGKVFFQETDIGAQMLRDGAALLDEDVHLSATDREVYSRCQIAAREEHRGVWQAPPVEPVKSQPVIADQSTSPRGERSPGESKRALTREDLVKGIAGYNGGTRKSYSIPTARENEWTEFAPAGERFSVQVPGVGVESSVTVPAGDEFMTVSRWVVSYRGTYYMLAWVRGPNGDYTDGQSMDGFANGFATGLNRALAQENTEQSFAASLQNPKLKLNGYAGRQYSISTSGVPGTVRIFSRQVGRDRELYMIGILNGSEHDPSVGKFFNSLSLDRK